MSGTLPCGPTRRLSGASTKGTRSTFCRVSNIQNTTHPLFSWLLFLFPNSLFLCTRPLLLILSHSPCFLLP